MKGSQKFTYQLLIDRLPNSEQSFPLRASEVISLEALKKGLLEALVPQKVPIDYSPTVNLVKEQLVVLGGGGVIVKDPQLKTVFP